MIESTFSTCLTKLLKRRELGRFKENWDSWWGKVGQVHISHISQSNEKGLDFDKVYTKSQIISDDTRCLEVIIRGGGVEFKSETKMFPSSWLALNKGHFRIIRGVPSTVLSRQTRNIDQILNRCSPRPPLYQVIVPPLGTTSFIWSFICSCDTKAYTITSYCHCCQSWKWPNFSRHLAIYIGQQQALGASCHWQV